MVLTSSVFTYITIGGYFVYEDGQQKIENFTWDLDWDLGKVSVVTRCPLRTVRYIEVSL